MNIPIAPRPFAVLADIHGNTLALEAVLADIRSRGIETIVNLGDTFYGPLDPAGTETLIMQKEIVSILGNQDRILLAPSPELEGIPTYRHTMDNLSGKALDWLASLKSEHWLHPDAILCCHGAPGDDCAYLTEDVSRGRPEQRSCGEIAESMGPLRPSLVLCGHSHIQRVARCAGLTVVNPGSVGLPAYSDDEPPHVMSSGSPHARYAVITPQEDGWEATPVQTKYDWSAAAEMARTNGRPDWAQWLRTGTAT
ncbi:metallophosphoesterase family protein [Salidesulfovibrio onnuriiensis]|uniref:metallophosphoesterase family protein n=1 Tax=Salidesulfovibrio onnuriiensis TaxID=2583823 RepID=UPI0011CAED98|nr:metallophosphoesterase family protein [Salidesulfovibrio onnuriiensis]